MTLHTFSKLLKTTNDHSGVAIAICTVNNIHMVVSIDGYKIEWLVSDLKE